MRKTVEDYIACFKRIEAGTASDEDYGVYGSGSHLAYLLGRVIELLEAK